MTPKQEQRVRSLGECHVIVQQPLVLCLTFSSNTQGQLTTEFRCSFVAFGEDRIQCTFKLYSRNTGGSVPILYCDIDSDWCFEYTFLQQKKDATERLNSLLSALVAQ